VSVIRRTSIENFKYDRRCGVLSAFELLPTYVLD
jgi:hypothetical protein